MARPLQVLSGSRVLSCGLGNAGLFHFFLDAGECCFIRFGPGLLYFPHVYSPIGRGSFSCSPHKYYDISREDVCLVHLHVCASTTKDTRRVFKYVRSHFCQAGICSWDARSESIGESPSAWPNVRSPWALFTLFYIKFHGRAFLQTFKVHSLKTIAVKEHLFPIGRENETKAPIPNHTLDCTPHKHLN